MEYDCWVSPDSKQICSDIYIALMRIDIAKWRRDNSDKAEARLSLAIAKRNYEIDTNNKYYKRLYDEAKTVWERQHKENNHAI